MPQHKSNGTARRGAKSGQSNHQFGSKWYYNPVSGQEMKIKAGETVPGGFIAGRMKSTSEASGVHCAVCGKLKKDYRYKTCSRECGEDLRGYRSTILWPEDDVLVAWYYVHGLSFQSIARAIEHETGQSMSDVTVGNRFKIQNLKYMNSEQVAERMKMLPSIPPVPQAHA